MQRKLQEAEARGLFRGQVLQSLSDIKAAISTMNGAQADQGAKIELKADKIDFQNLTKRVEGIDRYRWVTVGGLVVLQFIIAALLKG